MDANIQTKLDVIAIESDLILKKLAGNHDLKLIIECMDKRNALILQVLDKLPVSDRPPVLSQLLAMRDKEDSALIPYRQQLKETKEALLNIKNVRAYAEE